MKLKNVFAFVAALAAGLAVCAVSRVGLAVTYSVIDLGVVAGVDYSDGIDVNDVGQVAVNTWESGYFYGVLWENGTKTVITVPYPYNSPEAINNKGDIVGYASGSATESLGMLWQNGTATYMPEAPGGSFWTRARDINDSGMVVGNSYGDSNNNKYAYTWQGGVLNALGIVDVGFGPGNGLGLPRIESDAVKVNNAGQVLGVTTMDRIINGEFRQAQRAWTLHQGNLSILPSLAGDADADIFPYAINEQGDVLASYSSATNGYFFGVWHGGSILPLQALPGTGAYASAMNNSRVAVGLSFKDGPPGELPTTFASIWNSAGVPTDLHTVLDASGTGWNLKVARAINNRGWIVGQGTNPAGKERGFLLIPVPEPESVGICFMAVVGFLLVNTRFACARSVGW